MPKSIRNNAGNQKHGGRLGYPTEISAPRLLLAASAHPCSLPHRSSGCGVDLQASWALSNGACARDESARRGSMSPPLRRVRVDALLTAIALDAVWRSVTDAVAPWSPLAGTPLCRYPCPRVRHRDRRRESVGWQSWLAHLGMSGHRRYGIGHGYSAYVLADIWPSICTGSGSARGFAGGISGVGNEPTHPTLNRR